MAKLFTGILCLMALWLPRLAQAERPILRAAVLKVGTVNWELDVIKHHQFDHKNAYQLDVTGMANNAATRIAFQGNEADIVVADWIWVARQRADGKDYRFIPYSKSVGGVLVGADSAINSLADLKDKRIGIAGGPVDKSWLIIQALAMHRHGIDLAQETEQVFGAPPLIFKKALQGELDAVINFWHFMAKMEAKGFRRLVSVAEGATELGLSADLPLLGYVIKGELADTQPDLVRGFIASSRSAKLLLATDDAEWERLRPKLRAKDTATFEALKTGFRAGIPGQHPVNAAEAAAMLELMAELGGAKLVGKAVRLPDGIFHGG